MEYTITNEDLKKAFEFSAEYFLNKGGTASRTTGQYRGLGSIADDFMIGKIIELAVASILKQENKTAVLDFDIHALTEENRADPDIVGVVENGVTREPEVFVEIKVISETDRWIGLTREQFTTILSHQMANTNPENVYIIYATLKSKDSELNSDLLGAYLRCKLTNSCLGKFCKIGDLIVEIKYVLTGKELQDYGTYFDEGSLMYETELFAKVSDVTKKWVLDYKERDQFLLLEPDDDEFPMITPAYDGRIPEEFGKFTVSGDVEYILKKNEKSQRLYMICNTDVSVNNEVVGIFELKQGEVYDATLYTLGRSPTLKRNNVWIAHRNLGNIVEKTAEERIEEIKEKL